MRSAFLFVLLASVGMSVAAQDTAKNRNEINTVIDNYSLAREKRDTVLLKSILTSDIDQLVSTGEWRYGLPAAVKGMMASSAGSPGVRSITIDKIRFTSPETAIVDARYEIQNADGTARKMWSTFIVVHNTAGWKISAIRNMLPTNQK